MQETDPHAISDSAVCLSGSGTAQRASEGLFAHRVPSIKILWYAGIKALGCWIFGGILVSFLGAIVGPSVRSAISEFTGATTDAFTWYIAVATPIAFLLAARFTGLYRSVGFHTLLAAFAFGMFAVTIAAVLERLLLVVFTSSLDYVMAVMAAPLLEEALKAVVIFYLLHSRRHCRPLFPAVVVGFAVGMGFALVENFTKLMESSYGVGDAVNLVLSTTLMHGASAVFLSTAAAIAYSVAGPVLRWARRLTGVAAAMALHMAFNAYSSSIALYETAAYAEAWLNRLRVDHPSLYYDLRAAVVEPESMSYPPLPWIVGGASLLLVLALLRAGAEEQAEILRRFPIVGGRLADFMRSFPDSEDRLMTAYTSKEVDDLRAYLDALARTARAFDAWFTATPDSEVEDGTAEILICANEAHDRRLQVNAECLTEFLGSLEDHQAKLLSAFEVAADHYDATKSEAALKRALFALSALSDGRYSFDWYEFDWS